MIVLAGFLCILSRNFTGQYPRPDDQHPPVADSRPSAERAIYGLQVHEAALRQGVKVTGATVHFVNEIPRRRERFLLQKAVDVLPGRYPRNACSGGSWSRRNGNFCPRRRKWSAEQ